MATEVYTFLISYEGLEDKIWRKAQVSSNNRLDQLGYLVLAAFDTMANHLFEFEYDGQCFELPDEDADPDELVDMADYKLHQLKMKPGARMKMTYDFGMDQVFDLELLTVEPMAQGTGKHFPHVIDGAGCGILDDMPVFETRELIEQIDKNGCTDEPLFYKGSAEPWDYRQFDLKMHNFFLKCNIRVIQKAYEEFWDGYYE